jgi:octaprenyl-diphosphate synthase
VLEAIRACGSLEYARAAALSESQAAVRAIEGLPGSSYKVSLLELASFSVTRAS